MLAFIHGDLTGLLDSYGYWAVAVLIAIESMGIPVPGETMLLTATIYAGSTHRLDLAFLIVVAAAGAIVGDNLGFWLGRVFGYRLLLRYGPRIGLDHGRLKLGQYLFRRHGGKVVFLGRFVAVLRALAAFLAGANRMPWRRFLVFNAAGGVAWAALYGAGGYLLGDAVRHLLGGAGVVLMGLAVGAMIVGYFIVRRHEARLIAEAEAAMPGPLETI